MSTFVIIEEHKDRSGLVVHEVFKDDRTISNGLGYDAARLLVVKIGKHGDVIQEYYESSGQSARTVSIQEFIDNLKREGLLA